MKIGDILTHDGQRYVVCGFDPEGVSPRLIYVEDIATGLRSTLPFERDGSPRKPGGRRLRLVTEAELKKPRRDVPRPFSRGAGSFLRRQFQRSPGNTSFRVRPEPGVCWEFTVRGAVAVGRH